MNTRNEVALRLARVLRAENAALAAGDAGAAAGLLAEKLAAAEAVRAGVAEGVAGGVADRDVVTELRALVDENARRLSLAIEVQGRVLEMVARAARAAVPTDAGYGRRGVAAEAGGGRALVLRA